MNPEHDSFTPIAEIGEFGLIDRMTAAIGSNPESVIVGIGDDAAAVDRGEDSIELITTDALIEHVHFDRTYTPMRHLGYKAIAVNVSDIAAMNGLPKFATVAIGVPNSVSVEMIDALYAGIQDAAGELGLSIVGGDTCASQKLVLTVTAIGECRKSRLVRRQGAKPGNLICVTGTLGASYAGLRILQYHKQALLDEGAEYQPDLTPYASVVERHLRPRPRVDIVGSLERHDVLPTAMIDLSDGLASDLRHICKASAVGVDVDLESVPVGDETRAVASLLDDSPTQYALRGGEDYELLFTVNPSCEDVLSRIDDVQIVGTIVEPDRGIRVTENGRSEDIDSLGGFSHF